jgi:hypothetical protein
VDLKQQVLCDFDRLALHPDHHPPAAWTHPFVTAATSYSDNVIHTQQTPGSSPSSTPAVVVVVVVVSHFVHVVRPCAATDTLPSMYSMNMTCEPLYVRVREACVGRG